MKTRRWIACLVVFVLIGVLGQLAALAAPPRGAYPTAPGIRHQPTRLPTHQHFRPYYHQNRQQYVPSYQGGWFQRPYPYHLDYYRMKYGGTYEPYFGNLYGPPLYNYYYAPPERYYGGPYYY